MSYSGLQTWCWVRDYQSHSPNLGGPGLLGSNPFRTSQCGGRNVLSQGTR